MKNLYKAYTKPKDEYDTPTLVSGYYVRLNEEAHFIYTGYAETDCGEYFPEAFEINPDTLCECTGITDKCGNLVYTGDQVLIGLFLYSVEYDENTGSYEFFDKEGFKVDNIFFRDGFNAETMKLLTVVKNKFD